MILVASGSGVVACPIIEGLAKLGRPMRLLLGEPLRTKLEGDFEIRYGAIGDAATVSKAMEGVREVFITPKIEPNLIAKQVALIHGAQASGVNRITLVSTIGANPASPIRLLRWYGALEHELSERGIAHNVLRAAPFMQSLLVFVNRNFAERTILAPFREVRFPWLDAADLGSVAAVLAEDQTPGNHAYTLTGPQLFSFPDVAEVISATSGQKFNYVDITGHEAKGYLESRGMPPLKVLAYAEWWDALASGLIKMNLSDDVARLLGRPPRSLAEFIADHPETFGPRRESAAA